MVVLDRLYTFWNWRKCLAHEDDARIWYKNMAQEYGARIISAPGSRHFISTSESINQTKNNISQLSKRLK